MISRFLNPKRLTPKYLRRAFSFFPYNGCWKCITRYYFFQFPKQINLWDSFSFLISIILNWRFEQSAFSFRCDRCTRVALCLSSWRVSDCLCDLLSESDVDMSEVALKLASTLGILEKNPYSLYIYLCIATLVCTTPYRTPGNVQSLLFYIIVHAFCVEWTVAAIIEWNNMLTLPSK